MIETRSHLQHVLDEEHFWKLLSYGEGDSWFLETIQISTEKRFDSSRKSLGNMISLSILKNTFKLTKRLIQAYACSSNTYA